jgi:PAS domain S-box-containing protein
LVGYEREDLVSGRVCWTDLTPPEWHESTSQALDELRTTGTAPPREKEYFRKDGSRVPVLIGGAMFEGSRHQGVSYVLDLTERKRAEAEAHESERRYREVQMELAHVSRVTTLGELAASIAHEVNQPLTAIVINGEACLRWLDRAVPDLGEARSCVGGIIRAGRRASEIIQRLRALSRKTETQKVAMDINDAISEVIPLVQHEVLSHRVSLRLDLAPTLPAVLGDRVQLQQVIINLLVNGLDAMATVTDRSRELVVRSQLDDSGQVLVAVEDSGVGIDPENAKQLFNAFFTTKSSGMGMGLAICRSTIEAHGGRLWASANEPRGAVFQFILPRERDETVPAEHGGHMPAV